jgi:hypothetical protein
MRRLICECVISFTKVQSNGGSRQGDLGLNRWNADRWAGRPQAGHLTFLFHRSHCLHPTPVQILSHSPGLLI